MSASFKRPPIGTLVLPQLVEYNAQHSPGHPLFAYASSDGELSSITWSKAAAAIRRAARLVLKSRNKGDSKALIIGILANLDSITYHTLHLGVLRAGGAVFLISTRNSPATVAHLLKKTKIHRLFVSTDNSVQTLASSALAELRKDGHDVDVFTVPTFQDLYTTAPEDEDIDLPDHLEALIDSPAMILHSSGSSAFPKVIVSTHRVILQWAKLSNLPKMDEDKHRLAAHALPVFHGMGFFLIPWAARTGLSLGVFPPRERPVVPSPQNFLEAAIASKCTFMMTVPLFIELWSRSEGDVQKLMQFDVVLFGGGPLDKAIGDELSQRGICLLGAYGMTEIGFASVMAPRTPEDHEWEWMVLYPQCDARFLPQEDDPNVFELVYVVCADHTPAATNFEMDGKAACATNDLVIRHPKDPLKFKIVGRKDDQLMLSSGEKTNPGPIEAIICRHPLVEFAVMFGRGKDQNGILIKPAPGHETDPTDSAALARFRNAVWDSVEEANQFSPSHSRLYKEMILVSNPSRGFEMTAKHAPRRHAILEAYREEIEDAYNAVHESMQMGISPPAAWTLPEVLNFVRETVHKIIGKNVGDDEDIFQHGSDSLQATYIRNSIAHAVRETRKAATGQISQGFVYATPSIAGLADALFAIVEAGPIDDGDRLTSKVQEMTHLIKEYTTNFPEHQSTMSGAPWSGEIVLLTGTTGGLGTQLLSYLVSLPCISHVYAFNRPASRGSHSLRDRQAEALVERGLDVGVIDSPKVTLVEGDIAAPGLGIDSELYGKIRDSITLIIHNAWRVNFNMALVTFKPMLQGVRNLVDLALCSPREAPPRIIYTGSVGVYRGWRGPGRPSEARIDDPRLAIGNGYNESKFVGERILEAAAESTPLRPVIVRIGQMTSNSSGAWNSGDWLPAIVRSGEVLGVLPARDDCVAWFSLDLAARAIVDFRNSESQYLHLAHPNPVPWNTVFDVFSSMLNVPLVSWTEWLSQLEKNGGAEGNNPAVHLLDFYLESAPVKMDDREALGIPLLDLKEALKASPSLADPSLPQISREDAERWIRYWHSKGLLSRNLHKL